MKTILTAAAIVALLAGQAHADDFTYQCGRHDRIVFNDTAMTITWNKRVFSRAQQIEGCRAQYQATDASGLVATLCTSTGGVASLNVEGNPSHHLECEVRR